MVRIEIDKDQIKSYRVRQDEIAACNTCGKIWTSLSQEIVDCVSKVLQDNSIPKDHYTYILWALGEAKILKSVKGWDSDLENTTFKNFIRGLDKLDWIHKIRIDFSGQTLEGEEKYIRIDIDRHPVLKKEIRKKLLEFYTKAKARGRPRGKVDPATEERLTNLAYNLVNVIGIPEKQAIDIFINLCDAAELWPHIQEKRKKAKPYFKSMK